MSHSRARPRSEKAAPALRAVGAVLLAAGLVHLYADRVIFEARPFAAHAALSLSDPRVASYVAERIADELVAQKRDLVAYRPLLVGTARAVVSSEPFRAGFQRATEGAHALIFSQGAERIALSVPDIGVLVRGALAHDPGLVARIPAGLSPAADYADESVSGLAVSEGGVITVRFNEKSGVEERLLIDNVAVGLVLPGPTRARLGSDLPRDTPPAGS